MQRVIAWDLVNFATEHLIQPDAVDWYQDKAEGLRFPAPSSPWYHASRTMDRE